MYIIFIFSYIFQLESDENNDTRTYTTPTESECTVFLCCWALGTCVVMPDKTMEASYVAIGATTTAKRALSDIVYSIKYIILSTLINIIIH